MQPLSPEQQAVVAEAITRDRIQKKVRKHRRKTETGFYRAYEYQCVCGLYVKGQYRMNAFEFDLVSSSTSPAVPLDQDQARCDMVKGVPAGQLKHVFRMFHPEDEDEQERWTHKTGCGRTLRESNEARAYRKEAAIGGY